MERLTERLRIREFARGDLDDYAAIVADPEVVRYLGDGHPQSRATAAAYIEDMLARQAATGISRYAVTLREEGTFLGFCGFREVGEAPDAYVDFGWRYARRFWGQGIATEAALAVFDHGVRDLGLTNIAAGADAEHFASLAVIRKLPLPYRVDLESGGRAYIRYHQQRPARSV